MAEAKVTTRIGSNPPAERVVTGTPPVILQAQPTGFVVLNKPEEKISEHFMVYPWTQRRLRHVPSIVRRQLLFVRSFPAMPESAYSALR